MIFYTIFFRVTSFIYQTNIQTHNLHQVPQVCSMIISHVLVMIILYYLPVLVDQTCQISPPITYARVATSHMSCLSSYKYRCKSIIRSNMGKGNLDNIIFMKPSISTVTVVLYIRDHGGLGFLVQQYHPKISFAVLVKHNQAHLMSPERP